MTVPVDAKILKELTVAIHKQNAYNKTYNVILRGFVSGIFTALGATIGFALFMFLAGWVISVTGDIPLISTILRETKLDILIEKQLKLLEDVKDSPQTPSPSPTPTPSPTGTTGSGVNTN